MDVTTTYIHNVVKLTASTVAEQAANRGVWYRKFEATLKDGASVEFTLFASAPEQLEFFEEVA